VTINNVISELPHRVLFLSAPALFTRISTPPRLSFTHLKASLISCTFVTSHFSAYSFPGADCRDLSSSCKNNNNNNNNNIPGMNMYQNHLHAVEEVG
jgi:hypothetical protein